MCLEQAKLYSKPIGTEDKDIVCYKIYHRYNKSIFASLFQRKQQILGQLYEISEKNVNVLKGIGRSHWVEENAFHSFASLRSAKEFAKYLLGANKKYKLYVVKCIIPKYSKYIYVGKFNNYKSYASQQIIPIEVINVVSGEN